MEAGIAAFVFAVALVWWGFRTNRRTGRGGGRSGDNHEPPKPYVIEGPAICEECGEQVDRLNLLFTGDYICDYCEIMLLGD